MAEYKHIAIRGADPADTEHGDGLQSILLVHANVSDIRSFYAIIPLLAKDHNVVAYSRRFHWPNTPIAVGDCDPWDEQAEDVAELIEKLNLAPCNIIDLVKTLLLEEPPVFTLYLPRTPPTLTDILTFLWNHPRACIPVMRFGFFTVSAAETKFKAATDEEALQTFLEGGIEPRTSPKLIAKGKSYLFQLDLLNDDRNCSETYHKLTPKRMEQARTNMLPHNALFCYGSLPMITAKDVNKIATKTWLFTSEKTPGAQKCINALLVGLMPDAEEVHIKNASHLLHEDDPVAVAEAVKARITG